MKTLFARFVSFLSIVSLAVLLASCDHPVAQKVGGSSGGGGGGGGNSGVKNYAGQIPGTYVGNGYTLLFSSDKSGRISKGEYSIRAAASVPTGDFTWSSSGTTVTVNMKSGPSLSAAYDPSSKGISINGKTYPRKTGTSSSGGGSPSGGGGSGTGSGGNTGGGNASGSGTGGGQQGGSQQGGGNAGDSGNGGTSGGQQGSGSGTGSGGNSSGSGSSGGSGGNTLPATGDAISCTYHEWGYEFIGEKDDRMYHRAFCNRCGYEVTNECDGYSYCRDCNRIATPDNSHVEYPGNFFDIDKTSEKIPRLVIVANSSFKGTAPLEKYIAHKRKQGYETEVKYYATGTTSAETIRGELKTLYNQNSNMRVLIVGRGSMSQQYSIPEFVNNNKWDNRTAATDFYYGYYGDSNTNLDLTKYVPVGRLSAKSVEDLNAQVDKIIFMEENFASTSKNIVLVQHVSNTGEAYFGDETKALTKYFNDKRSDYTVKEVQTTPLGNINTAIQNGASLVSYAGHGGPTYWGSYNTTYVHQLRNTTIYPIILGVTCNTGNYTAGDECLAEAFMRTANGGAVGYVGASAAMIAYYSKAATAGNDKVPGMVGSLFWSNQYEDRYKVRTLGGMFLAALRSIKMSRDYAGTIAKDYSLEVLNLFGDPTYMPYTEAPKNINLGGYTATAGNPLTVTTGAPYAQVAITQADSTSPGGVKIIAAKIAGADGNVTLNIPSAAAGTATLYAIAPNHPGKSVTINIASPALSSGGGASSGTSESQPEDIGTA